MDDELREPVKVARLVGWATAAVLIVAAIGVGAFAARDDGPDGRIVTAAGQNADAVAVPTTVAEFVPPTLARTTVAPSTTVTTVRKPTTTAPTTTQLPRTTTTKGAGGDDDIDHRRPSRHQGDDGQLVALRRDP